MPSRSLAALAALLGPLLVVGTAAASAQEDQPAEPAQPAQEAQPAQQPPTLVIEGKGFGHGVGMAQDGAYAMAVEGKSAAAILSHFYPGTAIGRRSGSVRVGVHESPGPVVVVLPAGGEVRDAPSGGQSPGFPVTVSPGGSVRLSFDGSKYKATPLSGSAITRIAPPAAPAPAAKAPAPPTTPPPTPPPTGLLDPLLKAIVPTTAPPATPPPASAPGVPAGQNEALSSRGLWAVPKGDSAVALPEPGRSYRGTMQAAGAGAGLQLTNEIDVEQYVRGMGEMPASWPAAALQAQAIAARTFAIRAAAAGKTLCDDQQCQVYIGSGNEHPATSAAAVATKGQVLTYQGALAEAVYSASGGGISATPEEGFGPGSPDIPYLRPVRYSISDPQLWAMTLPLTEAGARFGYRGELREVRVSRTGPSERPLEITFEGESGPMTVDGHRFWGTLQLRSTLFTLRTEVAQPAVQGEPLAALVPDLPSYAPDPSAPAVVGTSVATEALGRAPWVGLALLLLAVWGTAANRVTTGGRRSTSGVGSPAAAVGDEAPTGHGDETTQTRLVTT